MKKLMAILGCLLLFSFLLHAQNTKGSIFIGSTTDLAGGVYNDLLTGTGNAAGLSFISSFSKSGSSTGDKIKETAFNISPRIGYLIIDNLVGGINLSIWTYSQKDSDYTDKLSSFSVGPFVRYYIISTELGNIRVMPFAEGKVIFGSLTSKYTYTGGESKDKAGLTIWAIEGGAAAFLSDHVSVDLIVGFKKFVTNYKDDDYKEICNAFGFGMGITVILSK